MGSPLEPDVQNNAHQRDPAPVPVGGEGQGGAELEAGFTLDESLGETIDWYRDYFARQDEQTRAA